MTRIALTVWLLLLALGAGAEPVKCVDAKGKTRYIDATMAAEEKCQPVPDSMNVVKPQAQPPGFGRGSGGGSSSAAATRSQIDDQIANAEARLAEAKKNLADQEAVRSGDERNYARVLERLKPYQDTVDQLQQQVDQLKAQR
jgi:hypothetical protein